MARAQALERARSIEIIAHEDHGLAPAGRARPASEYFRVIVARGAARRREPLGRGGTANAVRTPPAAGPSVVSSTTMKAARPDGASATATQRAPPA